MKLSKKTAPNAFEKFEDKLKIPKNPDEKQNFGYKSNFSNTTTLAGTREIKKDEIFGKKNSEAAATKVQSFGDDGNENRLRKVKTQKEPLDSWNLDLFSGEKKKKSKGSFADRFKRAIKKENNIYKTMPSKIQKDKKKKQESLAQKMKNTMNRGKNIGNEEEVVGQRDVAKNMNLELEAEDAEFEKLYECQQCGRSFKRDALKKHVKVCKKVFQLKRKEFEVEEKRLVSKEQKLLAAKGKRKMNVTKNLKGKKGKKWKKQSEGLRKLIKKNAKQNKKKKEIEVEIVV